MNSLKVFTQSKGQKQLFWYIPNITHEIDEINNKSIYKYFNLTKEEIRMIENKT